MKLCGFNVGLDQRFFLIAGPCVIESEQLQMDTAGTLKEITSSLGIPFIFKSSYDKANRSSGSTFRGPGMEKGLEILAKVKRELHVPILTDVHTEADISAVAAVVDVLQTARFAREDKVPYLGICLGMQVATIEYARNVAGLSLIHISEPTRPY